MDGSALPLALYWRRRRYSGRGKREEGRGKREEEVEVEEEVEEEEEVDPRAGIIDARPTD